MKQIALTLIALFGIHLTSSAQYRIAASSIGIEHQKDQKYLIKLKLLRPCNSNPYNGNANIQMASPGCTSFNLNLVNTSIKKIDFSCFDSLGIKYNGCATPNQLTGAGFELFTYETSIDISQAPFNSNCCEYTFSTANIFSNVNTLNWYDGITSGQGSQTAQTEMKVNLCLFKQYQNSGPIGYDNLITPMMLNQSTVANFGFFDYDSLAYEFAAPLDGNGNNLAYSAGYSANNPVSDYALDTFFLDHHNGDIIGTATKNNELGLTCLLVKEYKKDSNNQYQLIGSYRNDILFASYISKENNAPKLLGPYAYQVCEGEKLCFEIRSKDDPVIVPPPGVSPPADTIYLSWNKNIPNSTFKIKDLKVRERIGEFCWEPKIGDGSSLPYNFTVKATELGCSKSVSTTRGYSVTVLELPKLQKNIKVINGNELIVWAKALNPYSSIRTCNMTLKKLDNTPVFNDVIPQHPFNDSIFEKRYPPTTSYLGKYVVELIFRDPKTCPIVTIDTVEFTAPTNIKAIESNTSLFYNTLNHQLYWSSTASIQNIQLIDMAGKVILESNIDKNISQLAIPNSASGVYIVLMQSVEGLIRKKVWIE